MKDYRQDHSRSESMRKRKNRVPQHGLEYRRLKSQTMKGYTMRQMCWTRAQHLAAIRNAVVLPIYKFYNNTCTVRNEVLQQGKSFIQIWVEEWRAACPPTCHLLDCCYTCKYMHTYIPTHLPTYLPTYLHTYIHTYIRTMHTCIHMWKLAHFEHF